MHILINSPRRDYFCNFIWEWIGRYIWFSSRGFSPRAWREKLRILSSSCASRLRQNIYSRSIPHMFTVRFTVWGWKYVPKTETCRFVGWINKWRVSRTDTGETPGSVFPQGQSLQETLHSMQPCSSSLLGNHFLMKINLVLPQINSVLSQTAFLKNCEKLTQTNVNPQCPEHEPKKSSLVIQ